MLIKIAMVSGERSIAYWSDYLGARFIQIYKNVYMSKISKSPQRIINRNPEAV